MALFFLGYLYILKHAYFPVTTMPLTAVDRLIPYQGSGWVLYVSLWAYVQLPLSLIDNRRDLFLYGWSATGISMIGFAFFILWPTAVPPIADDVAGSLFSGIRSIDTTGNSCPSLHVAFSVFTALWLGRFLRKNMPSATLQLLNLLWCLGIVYSTLATKQHVALDAGAGAVLGFAGAVGQARLEKHKSLSGDLPATPAAVAQISPAARKL
jgi:membrane-associated phospholipid phosphatase